MSLTADQRIVRIQAIHDLLVHLPTGDYNITDDMVDLIDYIASRYDIAVRAVSRFEVETYSQRGLADWEWEKVKETPSWENLFDVVPATICDALTEANIKLRD